MHFMIKSTGSLVAFLALFVSLVLARPPQQRRAPPARPAAPAANRFQLNVGQPYQFGGSVHFTLLIQDSFTRQSMAIQNVIGSTQSCSYFATDLPTTSGKVLAKADIHAVGSETNIIALLGKMEAVLHGRQVVPNTNIQAPGSTGKDTGKICSQLVIDALGNLQQAGYISSTASNLAQSIKNYSPSGKAPSAQDMIPYSCTSDKEGMSCKAAGASVSRSKGVVKRPQSGSGRTGASSSRPLPARALPAPPIGGQSW